MSCLFPPFIAEVLPVRIKPTVHTSFKDIDADLSSSFLCSYVHVRCVVDSFIGKSLSDYPYICAFSKRWRKQISYRRDNARRNQLYGVPDPKATVDTSELADKVLSYILLSLFV